VPKVVRIRQATAADEASDAVLVGLAMQNHQAFGLLYDRYVGPIYRYCHRRLDDREEAEDATSLVFTRALAALPTHHGGSFRSWLFTIAHHVVLNTRRDASIDRPIDLVLGLADPGPSPEDLAAATERRLAVSQALAVLPEEQRQVVALRLAGLTGPEVAATLGRSHDSVRATQRRALVQLRRLLGITAETGEGFRAS
jgi:RNA polymerase sigma-70 factor, ECF subfamily